MSVAYRRRPAKDNGSPRLALWSLLAVAWLLVTASSAFVTGVPRPERPDGEPARWKVAVWMGLFMSLPLLLWGVERLAADAVGPWRH